MCLLPLCLCRYPSGLRSVPLVALGFVQREVWRLRCAAPHPLRHHAPGQQRSGLPPAGRGEEVLPGQLLMTRQGQEGEEGEEEEEGEENQERKDRAQTLQEPQTVRGLIPVCSWINRVGSVSGLRSVSAPNGCSSGKQASRHRFSFHDQTGRQEDKNLNPVK